MAKTTKDANLTNCTQTEAPEIVKTLGNYLIKLKSAYDKDSDDHVLLVVSVTDDFQALLKKVVIDEATTYLYDSDLPAIKRYKVKGWLMSSLYANHKELLFCKDLVDNKTVSIKLRTVDKLKSYASDLREGFQQIVKSVQEFEGFDITVKYEIAHKTVDAEAD